LRHQVPEGERNVHLRRLAAAVVAAAVTCVVAGCGGADDQTAATPTATSTPTAAATEDADKDKDEEAGGAKKDCDDVGGLHGTPKHKLPGSVPLVAGARVYESQGPFGRTTRYFAVAKGDGDALPEWRDKVDAKLKAAGYTVLDTDQEEGAEAEGHLSGPHTVDVQVISLCKDRVRIRYTVS
jgi:hypothetical protein